ncbi:MAG: hypothetical protein NDJ90_05985 [Oligoflexia bacterium]|nr:hypothetical protein [Oligoflexia bacterium]
MRSPSSSGTGRSVRRQSDIVIRPDGTVSISFLWSDLADGLGVSAPAQVGGCGFGEAPPAPVEFPMEEYRVCRLCPKGCGFDRVSQAQPRCGDYQLRVATAGLTLGDEPEIRGTRGSGAIMLSGCPLRCPSCHNPEMVAEGVPYSLEAFVELAEGLAAEGAHNLQLLSPTVHLPALRVALALLRARGFPIPIALKSSGYESVSELRALEGLVDLYIPDLKFGPESDRAARAGMPLLGDRSYFETARAAIAEMIHQVGPLVLDPAGLAVRGVLVRHVRAPLPATEREAILAYLDSLPAGVGRSILDNFVEFED